jgi:hypothetical protein
MGAGLSACLSARQWPAPDLPMPGPRGLRYPGIDYTLLYIYPHDLYMSAFKNQFPEPAMRENRARRESKLRIVQSKLERHHVSQDSGAAHSLYQSAR